MFRFLAWVHGLLFRLCWWALRLPFKALWATVLAIVALLGEEVRRWLGLALMGAMIVLLGKATMAVAPDSIKLPLVLVVLALVCIWALAVLRAVRFTLANNLMRVRNRQSIQGMAADIKATRRGVMDGMARATERTPLGGAFRSNREKTARRVKEQEAEDALRRERTEAAFRRADEDERRRDELAALEIDPYTDEPVGGGR